jgi:hypothetical protein
MPKRIYKPLIPHFEPIGHLYHDDGGQCLDSTTTILKAELDLYRFGSQAAPRRGTNVHKTAQYYDEKDLDLASLSAPELVAERIGEYLEQYILALKTHGIIVHANELMRYSKKYGYAGTIDKVVTIDGAHGTLDLKTNGKAITVENWHKWQTASYDELIREEFKALYDMALTKRWTLYLTPDKFRLVEHTGRRDFQEFLAFLAAHNLKCNNGYRKRKAELA